MSDRTDRLETCEPFDADLIDFSFGTLTGRRRAELVRHLSTCSACRHELESLTAVADVMLELTPDAEPPLGFESRLVERLETHESDHKRTVRHRFFAAAAAAVVVFALVGYVVGNSVSSHVTSSSRSVSRAPVMAALTAQGHRVGEVFLTSGRQTWVYMTFEDVDWPGVVWCQLHLRNGSVETVGQFTMSNGYGAWAAKVAAAGADVVSAQVTSARGTVLASAALANPR